MKKTVYPDWFNELWSDLQELATRNCGNKRKTYDECKKKKIGPEDIEYLVKCFANHTSTILNYRNSNEFMEDHKDLERWIKYETYTQWENGPKYPNGFGQETIPKTDQRKREAAQRFLHQGGVANDLDQIAGGGGGVRGRGQFDLNLLDDESTG